MVHGMEFRPYHLAHEWTNAGHEVWIVAAAYSHLRQTNPVVNEHFLHQLIDGIHYTWCKTPTYQHNGIKRARNIFTFLYRLKGFANHLQNVAWQPHIVIASSTYPLDIFQAKMIANRFHAKLVYEVHDLWPLTLIEVGGMSRFHPFVWLLQYAQYFAYRYADQVISMLPDAKTYMMAHGMAAHKYHVIPNGVARDLWLAHKKSLVSHPSIDLASLRQRHRFLLGYVGGHGLANALDDLLRAIGQLNDASIGVVLVGEGPEKKALMRLAEDLALTNLYFYPAISKKLVPDVLQQFDACYLGWKNRPIYRFGLNPNKLFDYMMAAKPILHASPLKRDLVSTIKCGITVEAENIGAIAQGVLAITALSLAEKEKMGRRAKRCVLKDYDYSSLAQNFLTYCSN